MRVEKTATVVYLTPAERDAFTTVYNILDSFSSDTAFSDWVEDVTDGDYPDSLAASIMAIISSARIDENRQNY